MSKFCNKCGQQLNDTDTQCRYCGAVLKSGSAAPNMSRPGDHGNMSPQGGYHSAPQQNGYGSAPQQPGYGNMPRQGGYGSMPQQRYGNMPPQNGYYGTPQPNAYGNMSPQGAYGSIPQKKHTGLIIAIISVITAVVIAAGAALYFFVLKKDDSSGGKNDAISIQHGYDTADELIENYAKAYQEKDLQLYKSTYADFVMGSDEFNKCADDFNDVCEQYDDIKMNILYDLTYHCDEDRRGELKLYIEDDYGKKVNIEEYYRYFVMMECKSESGAMETELNPRACKIDGKWVIIPGRY